MTALPIDAQITFVPASDLDRTRDFYQDVLGLVLVLDQGSCLIFRVTNEAFIGFCEHLDPIEGRSVILTLVVPDVDGWCDRVVANGGEIASGPEHSDRYAIRHAFIRDPDGHHVELQRFDDPDWAEPVR